MTFHQEPSMGSHCHPALGAGRRADVRTGPSCWITGKHAVRTVGAHERHHEVIREREAEEERNGMNDEVAAHLCRAVREDARKRQKCMVHEQGLSNVRVIN